MKNKLTVFFALSLVLFVAMGCSLGGLIGSDEEKPKDSSSKSSDATSTDKKEATPSGEIVEVGIPECDEMATYINDNTEAIEGSYLARGIVYIYKNYMLEKVKEGIGKMTDEEKSEMGKVCKESLKNLKDSVKK